MRWAAPAAYLSETHDGSWSMFWNISYSFLICRCFNISYPKCFFCKKLRELHCSLLRIDRGSVKKMPKTRVAKPTNKQYQLLPNPAKPRKTFNHPRCCTKFLSNSGMLLLSTTTQSPCKSPLLLVPRPSQATYFSFARRLSFIWSA